MTHLPTLAEKITPKQSKCGPHLGPGVHIRQKFQFMIVMGVFGKSANMHTVCRQLYVTSSFLEPKKNKRTDKTEMVEVINDATAYTRLENICRDGAASKSLIREELDYLRQCYTQLFGANAMGHISDAFLLDGSMLQLLKCLNGAPVDLDWRGVDPILALEAVTAMSDQAVPVTMEPYTGTRWTKQRGGAKITLPEDHLETWPTQSAYRILIDAEIAREKPIVFEFLQAGEGKADDGRPARAQIFSHVVRSEDGEGPWRVSEPNNQPLEMGAEPARLGICAISGIGQSLAALLPAGSDPYCLSDSDLQSLARHVLEQAVMATPPRIGMTRYQVITPDAVESPPKSRGEQRVAPRR